MRRRYHDFEPLDRIRLEVEGDHPTGAKNLIRNRLSPGSTPIGAWGYVTPQVNTVLKTVSGIAALEFSTTVTQPSFFATEMVPATPGVRAAGRLNIVARSTTDETVKLRLDFFDVTGALISSGTQSIAYGTGSPQTPFTTTPAGTAYMQLRADVYTAAGNLAAGRWVQYGSVALATDPGLPDPEDIMGALSSPVWTNILEPTHEISIERESLDVATLTAALISEALHPATVTTVRPGRRIRLTVLDPSTSQWCTVFAGNIRGTQVHHFPEAPAGQQVRVTITATDAATTLANVSRRLCVGTVENLRMVLEGSGVAWKINGDGSQIPNEPFIFFDDTSALDQVAVLRDSALGYAWFDRENTLQVYEPDLMPASVVAEFGEDEYSAVEVDYNTESCINSVTVEALEADVDGKATEVDHGPFVDQTSIDTWGPFAAEFTVHGITAPAAVKAYAAAILGSNATPQIRINAISLPVTHAAHLALATPRALLDLYDLVEVTTAATGAQNLRVTRITHTIDTYGWLIDLAFAPADAVALPSR